MRSKALQKVAGQGDGPAGNRNTGVVSPGGRTRAGVGSTAAIVVPLDDELQQIPNLKKRGVKSNEALRISEAGKVLPLLCEAAGRIFPLCQMMRLTAVLTSWAALAGIKGWTPLMVKRVEREMAK